MRGSDGEFVDVDLAARLLKLLELVSDESAQHLLVRDRGERHDVLLREQVPQIGMVRRGGAVGVGLAESLAEQEIQLPQKGQVGRAETTDGEGRRGHHGSVARSARSGPYLRPPCGTISGTKDARWLCPARGKQAMSENATHAGHSGHQGMNPSKERLEKEGDEKERKQGEMGKSHVGETGLRAGEGTEAGRSGRGDR